MKRLSEFTHQNNKLIVEYMSPYIEKTITVGIVFLIVTMFQMDLDHRTHTLIMYFDWIFLLIALFIKFNKHISAQLKVQILLLAIFPMGLLSFYQRLYYGSAYFNMLLVIVVSILLLNRQIFFYYIFTSAVSFALMYVLVSTHSLRLESSTFSMANNPSTILLHGLGFLLVSFTLYILLTAIREYLIDTILQLKNHVAELDQKNRILNEQNEHIYKLAYYDQNTGLPNRTHFSNQIDQLLTQNTDGCFLMLDIINFKRINSFYGVRKGSQVLSEVAEYLQNDYPHKHIAGYLGGNTFGLWLESTPSKTQLVENLIHHEKRLNEKLALYTPLQFYVSIIPKFNEFHNHEILFKQADLSIEKLKREKGLRYLFYSPETLYDLQLDLDLYQKIENAIINDKFIVYYQEKVDSRTNEPIAVEALARLIYDGKFISPALFIDIIEEHGLMNAFGLLMIEKVFSDYPKLVNRYGQYVHIGINVSPSQISNISFIDMLQHLLKKYDVNPQNIELELTENVFVSNKDEVNSIIKKLQSIGFKIAIDDFGVGYSSLHYIATFNVDVIKIDKTFIDGLMENPKIEALVDSIIKVAAIANIEVIAEGVETPTQRDKLTELGCYYIQGYLYSKPQPLN